MKLATNYIRKIDNRTQDNSKIQGNSKLYYADSFTAQSFLKNNFKKTQNIINRLSFSGNKKDYQQIIENLRQSLSNIPLENEDRVNFIKKFLLTKIRLNNTDSKFADESLKERYIDREALKLSTLDDRTLKLALEHALYVSEIVNMDTPYPHLFGMVKNDSNYYENISKRGIYQLLKHRQESAPEDKISVYTIEMLAQCDDEAYSRFIQTLGNIGLEDKNYNMDDLINFAISKETREIEYYISEGLLSLENCAFFNNYNEMFHAFLNASLKTIKRINSTGILKTKNDNSQRINFNKLTYLAEILNENEWNNVIKHKLITYTAQNGTQFDAITIRHLACQPDEIFSIIESRGLLDLKINQIKKIIVLANLTEYNWQKALKRKIDFSQVDLTSAENIHAILSISDKQNKIAQKRGIKFRDYKEIKLLDLTDKEWDNLIRRKLNSINENGYSNYSIDSQIILSKLSDEEFDRAGKRGILKKKSNRNYSQVDVYLAKCSDEEFALYKKRNIEKYNPSLNMTINMLKMTDEQFARIENDIAPALEKRKFDGIFWEDESDAKSDYYKLAFLSDEKYRLAKEFLYVDYLSTSQLSYNQINQIIQENPEKISILKGIFAGTKHDKNSYINKTTILRLLDYDCEQLKTILANRHYLTSEQMYYLAQDSNVYKVITSESFQYNKDIIQVINQTDLKSSAKNIIVNLILGITNNDYVDMKPQDLMAMLNALQEISQLDIKNLRKLKGIDLENEMTKIQTYIENTILTTSVSKQDTIAMMKNFFAVNNSSLDSLIINYDFEKFRKNGLPLLYSRKSFLRDLTNLMTEIPKDEHEIIYNKLKITPITIGDIIIGYDGIINLNSLSTSGNEGKILSLANKFIKQNKIVTDNKQINTALNSLISGMPEFINIIGKEQHATHDYALDIHILTVLKNSLNNPKYNDLSNTEKFCLKFSAILHDIAKSEFNIDDAHAQLCALYARDILNKKYIRLSENIKDKIYSLILNHHWLARYNTGKITAKEVAAMFRANNDFELAQIMAEADLKSVKGNGSFYNQYSHALDTAKLMPIYKELSNMNKYGQIFLTNKIIDKSKIPTVEINGKTYRILNLAEQNEDEDLSKYGFEPNTTPKNLRLLVHIVKSDELSNLSNVSRLSNPHYQGYLCASYISMNEKNTYGNNKFGANIYGYNTNIANASPFNMLSGYEKEVGKFIATITSDNPKDSNRNLIPAQICAILNITSDEYAQLYKEIQKIKYNTQLDNIDKIQIGERIFTGKQIKNAILEANEIIINKKKANKHNEVNIYIPKTDSIIAKVDSVGEIPQQLLNIASNLDLPILILGNA